VDNLRPGHESRVNNRNADLEGLSDEQLDRMLERYDRVIVGRGGTRERNLLNDRRKGSHNQKSHGSV
jgi:hypothetical protein